MPVSGDILASYRRPRQVVRRLLDLGEHEGRVLAMLMGACVLLFVAQWPRLSREAHVTSQELEPLLGGALLGIVIFLPLIFYLFAFVSYLVLGALGWSGSAYGARFALFWAMLASSPLMLLWGLINGFVGPGPGLQITGILWLCAIIWFWVVSLQEAGRRS